MAEVLFGGAKAEEHLWKLIGVVWAGKAVLEGLEYPFDLMA